MIFYTITHIFLRYHNISFMRSKLISQNVISRNLQMSKNRTPLKKVFIFYKSPRGPWMRSTFFYKCSVFQSEVPIRLSFSQIEPQNMLKYAHLKTLKRANFMKYAWREWVRKGSKMEKILTFVPSRLLKFPKF